MNNLIKIGNWWFLDSDVNRAKDHADTVCGEVAINR